MRYLAELKEGEMVREIYLCKKLQTLKTKAGKSYLSVTLQDKTGMLDAKVWELGAGIEHFEVMDYIFIDGQVTSFQGALQMNIKRARKCQEGEYDPADYMPMTTRNIEEMYGELLDLIAMVKEPHLQELCRAFSCRTRISRRGLRSIRRRRQCTMVLSADCWNIRSAWRSCVHSWRIHTNF